MHAIGRVHVESAANGAPDVDHGLWPNDPVAAIVERLPRGPAALEMAG
jgi:hypothetical protein